MSAVWSDNIRYSNGTPKSLKTQENRLFIVSMSQANLRESEDTREQVVHSIHESGQFEGLTTEVSYRSNLKQLDKSVT
jgi:hypothetical protein